MFIFKDIYYYFLLIVYLFANFSLFCFDWTQFLFRSDWDTESTTSSEKENRLREKDDESLDEVVLRRSQRSNSSDMPSSIDKNKENRNTRTKAEIDLVALRKKTRKRTRKFVVDGVVVTTRQVIIFLFNFYSVFIV